MQIHNVRTFFIFKLLFFYVFKQIKTAEVRRNQYYVIIYRISTIRKKDSIKHDERRNLKSSKIIYCCELHIC